MPSSSSALPSRASGAAVNPGRRLHWVCLGPHLQGMVLRTCLPARDLRQLMAPYTDVLSPSDFELRCEAARLASQHAGVARALQGTLDGLHGAAVERSSHAQTEAALLALWDAAMRSGDVRGACWALITDRRSTPRLSLLISRDIEQLTGSATVPRERDAAGPAHPRPQAALRGRPPQRPPIHPRAVGAARVSGRRLRGSGDRPRRSG